jgi:hypothetical protein
MSNFKHTPGPWQWDVTHSGEIRLVTPDRGKLYVMGFERKGMRGAQPKFSKWGDGPRERRGGIMHPFEEAGGAEHPDARLIAAAPESHEANKLSLTVLCAIRAAGVLSHDTNILRDLDSAISANRAAIAKATGESA